MKIAVASDDGTTIASHFGKNTVTGHARGLSDADRSSSRRPRPTRPFGGTSRAASRTIPARVAGTEVRNAGQEPTRNGTRWVLLLSPLRNEVSAQSWNSVSGPALRQVRRQAAAGGVPASRVAEEEAGVLIRATSVRISAYTYTRPAGVTDTGSWSLRREFGNCERKER
jgi:hypothetical protein